MKQQHYALMMVLAFGAAISSFGGANPTPVTAYGSNPWFSTDLYPQDILQRSGNYLFYSPNYNNNPYWGDIDEPASKPTNTNNDYTITGADVVRDGGSFKHTGAVHTFGNSLGYAWQANDRVMASFNVDYRLDALRNYAEGKFTSTNPEYYPSDSLLPFDYSMRHTLNQFMLKGFLGTTLGTIPVGIRIDGGMQNTVALNKELSFSKLAKNPDGTFSSTWANYSMKDEEAKAFLGWTEPGCSHPFGPRGTQGDSWLQNEYAIGPIYYGSISGGFTVDRVKGGVFYRLKRGHQDRYYWENYDTVINNQTVQKIVNNDSTVSNNFIGRYVKQDEASLNAAGEGGLFSNITWRRGDRYALNTFVAISFLDSTMGSASADDLANIGNSTEKVRTFNIEFAPNMSVKLGEFLNYVDAALLIRYRNTRYENTYDRWDGVRTYWETRVNTEGWENIWENFSYAKENSGDIGVDFATMFPLAKVGPHYLGLNLRLFGDVRFTSQNKFFGDTNIVSNGEATIPVSNIRKNLSREVFFNTFLMLHYMQGPYQLRLQFTQPMLYSIAPSTRVTDAKGNIVSDGNNYPLKKSPLWITKEGFNVALFATVEFTPSFLRHSR
jgi:hypothetical protein